MPLSTTFGAGDVTGTNDIPGQNRQQTGITYASPMTAAQNAQQAALQHQFFAPLYAQGMTDQQVTDWLRALPTSQSDKINNDYWLYASGKLNPDTGMEKALQDISLGLSMAGLGAIGGAVIAPEAAAAAGSAGLGAGAADFAGGLAGGAFTGATGAAIQGQPIGKGALTGALGAGISSGLSGLGVGQGISDLTGGGALGNTLGTVGTGALGGGAAAGLRGGNIGQGALSGAIRGLTGTIGNTGSPTLGSATDTGTPADPTTYGSGVNADQPAYDPLGVDPLAGPSTFGPPATVSGGAPIAPPATTEPPATLDPITVTAHPYTPPVIAGPTGSPTGTNNDPGTLDPITVNAKPFTPTIPTGGIAPTGTNNDPGTLDPITVSGKPLSGSPTIPYIPPFTNPTSVPSGAPTVPSSSAPTQPSNNGLGSLLTGILGKLVDPSSLPGLVSSILQLTQGNQPGNNQTTPYLPSISGFSGPSAMNINSAPQRQLNPALASMTPQDWYTYGQKPANQLPTGGNFFSQTPASAASGMSPQAAGIGQTVPQQGGALAAAHNLSPPPMIADPGYMPRNFTPPTAQEIAAGKQYVQTHPQAMVMASGGSTNQEPAAGYAGFANQAAPQPPGQSIIHRQFSGAPPPNVVSPEGVPSPLQLRDIIARAAMQERMMNMAHGGEVGALGQAQHPHVGYVQGPGDGQSDDIDAKLANGEYVFSADVVSALGNGSNDAGAKKLDEFMHNVRTHVSTNHSKGKLQPKAKPPEKYLGK